MKKTMFALLSFFFVLGCAATQPQLTGTWVEPIPSMPGQVQGIRLEPGGKASSVNMATLLYTQWKTQNGQLILEGKSLGNGQTISFSEVFYIDKLTPEELVLSSEGNTRRYTRQK